MNEELPQRIRTHHKRVFHDELLHWIIDWTEAISKSSGYNFTMGHSFQGLTCEPRTETWLTQAGSWPHLRGIPAAAKLGLPWPWTCKQGKCWREQLRRAHTLHPTEVLEWPVATSNTTWADRMSLTVRFLPSRGRADRKHGGISGHAETCVIPGWSRLWSTNKAQFIPS